MKIKRIVGGALSSNGYIIYQKSGGSCYIIDPGYNPQKFTNFVLLENLRCKGVLLTHLHSDHVGAAETVADELGCKIYMGEGDFFVYKGRVDEALKDEQELDLDGEKLKILNTPGHTAGGICILSEKSKLAFTGDTIFDTDLGRTDLIGGSEYAMESSIKNVIDKWSNDYTIYPGHDGSATMKFVRANNKEFIDIVSKGHRDMIEY